MSTKIKDWTSLVIKFNSQNHKIISKNSFPSDLFMLTNYIYDRTNHHRNICLMMAQCVINYPTDQEKDEWLNIFTKIYGTD